VRVRLAVFTLAMLLGSGTAIATAARAPSYLERVTIMDAYNVPGRSVASRCVRIVVSTVDPRYAMLTSPLQYPQACLRANETGDGWAFFRRSTRRSLHWRDIREQSDPPCWLPARVLHDLLPQIKC
jgi:hypothetical protein